MVDNQVVEKQIMILSPHPTHINCINLKLKFKNEIVQQHHLSMIRIIFKWQEFNMKSDITQHKTSMFALSESGMNAKLFRLGQKAT